MSQAPYLLSAKARWGYRLGDGTLTDVIMQDGLLCATHGYPMGITAENIAREYGISREMQDALALHSQQKAARAAAPAIGRPGRRYPRLRAGAIALSHPRTSAPGS